MKVKYIFWLNLFLSLSFAAVAFAADNPPGLSQEQCDPSQKQYHIDRFNTCVQQGLGLGSRDPEYCLNWAGCKEMIKDSVSLVPKEQCDPSRKDFYLGRYNSCMEQKMCGDTRVQNGTCKDYCLDWAGCKELLGNSL